MSCSKNHPLHSFVCINFDGICFFYRDRRVYKLFLEHLSVKNYAPSLFRPKQKASKDCCRYKSARHTCQLLLLVSFWCAHNTIYYIQYMDCGFWNRNIVFSGIWNLCGFEHRLKCFIFWSFFKAENILLLKLSFFFYKTYTMWTSMTSYHILYGHLRWLKYSHKLWLKLL